MIVEAVSAFRSADVIFRLADEPWMHDAYFRLRREIFAGEQKLFVDDDRDEIDDRAHPIVAIAQTAGIPDQVVGVVRIYETTRGRWWGGRLGVRRDYRRATTLGPGLIRKAVGTAVRRGCETFSATVQLPNVRLFERMHWQVKDRVSVCGVEHAYMEADLSHYGAVR